MARLDFDRWDYGATKVLLLLTLVAAPLLAVGLPLLAWARGAELTWGIHLDAVDGLAAPVADPAVRDGVVAVLDGSVRVTVAEPDTWLRLATLLPGVVVAVAAVLVVLPLLRLVGSVQRGDSFSDRAVTKLRTVAMTVVLAPWVYLAAAGIAEGAVRDQALGSGAVLAVVVDGTALLISALGLVVGAVAEAFRQGTRLRDDVDGLV